MQISFINNHYKMIWNLILCCVSCSLRKSFCCVESICFHWIIISMLSWRRERTWRIMKKRLKQRQFLPCGGVKSHSYIAFHTRSRLWASQIGGRRMGWCRWWWRYRGIESLLHDIHDSRNKIYIHCAAVHLPKVIFRRSVNDQFASVASRVWFSTCHRNEWRSWIWIGTHVDSVCPPFMCQIGDKSWFKMKTMYIW